MSWNVLVVRPRNEKCVASSLANKGIEQYLPLYRGRHRSGGRYVDVDLPLFAGYVFCRGADRRRVEVLRTPGVFRFVTFGGQLAPVEETELDAIRQAVGAQLRVRAWPFLRQGDYVRVEEGPLRGVKGRLVSADGEDKLILTVSLLNRSVAVSVERRWIRPSAGPQRGERTT